MLFFLGMCKLMYYLVMVTGNLVFLLSIEIHGIQSELIFGIVDLYLVLLTMENTLVVYRTFTLCCYYSRYSTILIFLSLILTANSFYRGPLGVF